MKSTFDIEDALYQFVSNSSFKSLISGSIYKGPDSRPVNATTEDVVIAALSTNNLQLQSSIININIHVPNVVVNVKGIGNQMVNHARMKLLTAAALKLLKEVWADDYHFSIQQQNLFKEEGSSYTNIRLDFYSINDETY